MSSQLQLGEEIQLSDRTYTVGEHPFAPGVAYGQEGRQGIVYQLVSTGGEKRALKVFRKQYVRKETVALSKQLSTYADLPGCKVCARIVITPETHQSLLENKEELHYAVVMPWVQGPTWMDIVMEQRVLYKKECASIASSLAMVLKELESRNMAHGDLSGANVLLPMLLDNPSSQFFSVELVDVEQMYIVDGQKPNKLPVGSPGYAKQGQTINWDKYADRLSGAILLAEMLGWCDEQVRELAWGESYFDPADIQRDHERYQQLRESLTKNWGTDVARLFVQAWESTSLQQCPTFADWLEALGDTEQKPVEKANVQFYTDHYRTLEQGIQLEEAGDLKGARKLYQQVLAALPSQHNLAQETSLMLTALQTKQHQQRKQAIISFFTNKKVWLGSILAVIICVIGIFSWSKVTEPSISAMPVGQQMEIIVMQQNSVVETHNTMTKHYDEINTFANQMQNTIKNDSSVKRGDVIKINNELRKLQQEMQAYQMAIDGFSKIVKETETHVKKGQAADTKVVQFLTKANQLSTVYQQYSKVMQAMVRSDQEYYKQIAAGTIPTDGNYTQLVQQSKQHLVIINKLESEVMTLANNINYPTT